MSSRLPTPSERARFKREVERVSSGSGSSAIPTKSEQTKFKEYVKRRGSGGGGSSSRTPTPTSTSVQDALDKQKALQEKQQADLRKLQQQAQERLKNIKEEQKRKQILIEFQKQSDKRQRLILEKEQRRIDDLRERAKKDNAQSSSRVFTDANTGEKIKVTTTSVDSIKNGVKSEYKIIERENLNTGIIDIQTLEYDKKIGRMGRTGGLSYGKGSAKFIKEEKILNQLLKNEKARLDRAVSSGKLTKAEGQKIYDAFKQGRIREFNKKFETKGISGVVSAKEDKNLKKFLSSKIFQMNKDIKKYFNSIPTNLKNQFQYENPSFVVKQIKKVYEFKNKITNLKTNTLTNVGSKIIGAKGNKAIEDLYKTLSPSNQQLLTDYGKMTPIQRQLVRVSIPAEVIDKGFELSKKGWDDLLFTTKADAKTQNTLRGLGLKRTPVTEFIPKAITGVGRLAVWSIPGVGNLVLVSDIFKHGKIYTMPERKAKQMMLDSYKDYKKNTILKENERLLTQKEFTNLNSKVFIDAIKRNAIKGMIIDVTFLSMGRILKSFKKAGKIGFKYLKVKNPKMFKITGKITKPITKVWKSGKIYKATHKRRIKGAKVPRKEFKSYKKELAKANNYLKSIKKINNVKNMGQQGKVTKIISQFISKTGKRHIESWNKYLKISKDNLKNVKRLEETIISNKYSYEIPVLRRMKIGKKYTWKFYTTTKTFYANTVSASIKGLKNKELGTMTLQSISLKPHIKFRNGLTMFKSGSGKQIIFSKKVGSNYIKSIVKTMDKRMKNRTNQYISKYFTRQVKGVMDLPLTYKTKPFFIENIDKIFVDTRKVLRTRGTISKQFKTGYKISKSKARIIKKGKKIKKIQTRKGIKVITEMEIRSIKGQTILNKYAQIIKKAKKGLSKDYKLKKLLSLEFKKQKSYIKTLEKIRVAGRKRLNEINGKINKIKYKRKLSSRDNLNLKNLKQKLNKTFSEYQRKLGNIEKLISKNNIDIYFKKVKAGLIKKPSPMRELKSIKSKVKTNNIRKIKLSSLDAKTNYKRLSPSEVVKRNIGNMKKIKTSSFQRKKINQLYLQMKPVKARKLENKIINDYVNSLIPPKISPQKLKIIGARGLEKNVIATARATNIINSSIILSRISLVGMKQLSKVKLLLNQQVASLNKLAKMSISALVKQNKKLNETKTILKSVTKQLHVKIVPIIIPIKPVIKIKVKIKPIKPVIKIPIIFKRKKDKSPNFKVLSKPQMTYKVFVKKRGKNVLLGERLIQKDAKNLMAFELDESLLRSAVIKNHGRFKVATKLPPKYNGAFLNRAKKFRQYKIKRKKKKTIKGYIEKQRYAKDTKNEQLQLRRLARRKKKQIKRKVVRRKPVKRKVVRRKPVKKVNKRKPKKKRKVNK